MQVESLDHIHIYAADPHASAQFYEQHFEAKEVHRNTGEAGEVQLFMALGGQIVVVASFPAGMTPAAPPDSADGAYSHGFGVAHFGLRVLDIEAAIEEMSNEGVRILTEQFEGFQGLEYAYIAAPDGVVIELTQYETPG
jgi:catechol 2,3-dioxygenase-like lactoylglutathione lyase family enzyme